MKYVVSTLLTLLLALSVASADIIRPNGDGTETEWKHIGCGKDSGEWECVDEEEADPDDYLKASSEIEHTVLLEDLGLTTQTITSVRLIYYGMEHNGFMNSCIEPMMVTNGATYYSEDSICLNTTWAHYYQDYYENPVTNQPWTGAEIDALEFGMRGFGQFAGGRIGQLYVDVNYLPAPDLIIESFDTYEYNELINETNHTLVNSTIVVKNVGGSTAGASSTRFIFSGGTTTTHPTPSLEVGETFTFTRSDICTGGAEIEVIADFGGAVTESDETNNVAERTVCQ